MIAPGIAGKTAASDDVEAFLAGQRRLAVVDVAGDAQVEGRLRRDVAAGLGRPPGQRSLPCSWFYDAEGSRLYERITELDEYYPTRTEARILARRAPELRRILGRAASTVVELGSGSSEKTRILFDAWDARTRPVLYAPIDVSRDMLADSAAKLVAEYPALRVLALVGSYHEGLAALAPGPDTLLCFLGGTIGNFAPPEQDAFIRLLADRLPRGAAFLLGFDRTPHANKPVSRIVAAYDDAAGITARFNLNLLARLNRELGASFDLDAFAHRASWNPDAEQIEIHIESLADQTVAIPDLGHFAFARGERIHTEISRRYDPVRLSPWMLARGFATEAAFTDDDELFALLLLRRS